MVAPRWLVTLYSQASSSLSPKRPVNVSLTKRRRTGPVERKKQLERSFKARFLPVCSRVRSPGRGSGLLAGVYERVSSDQPGELLAVAACPGGSAWHHLGGRWRDGVGPQHLERRYIRARLPGGVSLCKRRRLLEPEVRSKWDRDRPEQQPLWCWRTRNFGRADKPASRRPPGWQRHPANPRPCAAAQRLRAARLQQHRTRRRRRLGSQGWRGPSPGLLPLF